MKSFFFLRHGQTAWNASNRLQGLTDIPLNEAGRIQARLASDKLRSVHFDAIISSPLIRAKETADIVAMDRNITVITDCRLRERYNGAIEGMTKEEIESFPPEKLFISPVVFDWSGLRMPLDAEHLDDVGARAIEAMHEHLPLHDDGKVLVVGHGAWFRSLVYRLTGDILHPSNAAPYICEVRNGKWSITLVS